MSKQKMMRPLHERIVVKPFPPEDKSEGGIIVPDSVKVRPSKATVIAVGNGLKDRPMELKDGDVIFHVKGCGTLVDEKEDLWIMTDRDVLAIL